MLSTPDNTQLYFKTWLPAGAPRGVVLVVHGLAEHSGRYAHVAEFLNGKGFAVCGFDLRGHGRSEGKRIYIHRFDQHVKDLDVVLSHIKSEYPDLPFFMLAHSMGTTVVLKYLLEKSPEVAGVILTGTAIMPGADISPILISLSGFVGALMPRLPTVALNSNTVSRDPAVVKAYHDDPLVYNGKIPARTGAELNRAFKDIQGNMHKLEIPMLIMHGSADQLTNPEGSVRLHQAIASKDKRLIMWPGLSHEIMNEPEKQDVLDEIGTWIEAHLNRSSPR